MVTPLTFYESKFYIATGSSYKPLTRLCARSITHIIDCSNPNYVDKNDDRFIVSAESFCHSLLPLFADTKYCLLSSISVFGDEQSFISSDIVPRPSNMYGKSKLLKESYLSSLFTAGYFNSLSVIRPTGVLGRGMPNTFVRRLFESARFNKPVSIHSRDSFFNSIVFVDDLVNLVMLSFGLESMQTLFAASYQPITLLDLCQHVIEYCGSSSHIIENNSGRPPYCLEFNNSNYSSCYRSTESCLNHSLPHLL